MAQGNVAIRYILETRAGLSHARNRGVSEARGEIIAFTDDDAEADRYWLAALLDAYDAHPDAWAVGGRVRGLWDVPRPDWLPENNLRSLSLVDPGAEVCALAWPDCIIGVNMSFRRTAFETCGTFNTKIGRRGHSLLSSEDTEFQQRIHEHGGSVYTTPHALVWHRVPAERATRGYFFRRSYGYGRSKAIMATLRKSAHRPESGAVRHLLLLAQSLAWLAVNALRRRSLLAGVMRLCMAVGYLRQYISLHIAPESET